MRQFSTSQDTKYLGTAETLKVLLEHRKILSECIKEMDAQAVNYIAEQQLFAHVKSYTSLVSSDTRKRVEIACSTDNLLQAHMVMDVDKGEGENRLYFQESVLAVVRLCDVSLFKKLTDVQLKTHLQMLNQAHRQMQDGHYDYTDNSDDFVEFVDNLLLNIGRLMSDIRRNVVKMQSLSKELEVLTAQSVKSTNDSDAFIEAKQQWLQQIVKLYERHIMPVLQFLNPDTTYEGVEGLHTVLCKIRDNLQSHNQSKVANNIQSYILSFLNFYQPIEDTANAVNRFIHKERDSIRRFNAIEHLYHSKLIPELENTQSDNLNKKLMGKAAIILPEFSPFVKGIGRPIGYAFNDSAAYFKNLFNELESRTKDAYTTSDLSLVFGKATVNDDAIKRMQRHHALMALFEKIQLRPSNDMLKVLHLRLKDEFEQYQLYDLISATYYYAKNNKTADFAFKSTNLFAVAEHNKQQYRYRKIRCLNTDNTTEAKD